MMSQCMKVAVFATVDRAAVSYDEGHKILEMVQPAVIAGDRVVLDFSNVDVFASPFFNGLLAILYRQLGSDRYEKLIKIKNLTHEGETIAIRSIENARSMDEPGRQERLAEILKEDGDK